ncbi:hypothetical protein CBM2587_B20055 [Cupriavidus taiwanensis]|uniref:Uncharacterized protein n=1 Tax=Cupriavidus taiwanensis TaxID=164546 RepID=A0A976A4L6_9BURK|nr:hypothetical protein CBM2587_B20055 [Cupriavidus taiwanensis]
MEAPLGFCLRILVSGGGAGNMKLI